MATANFDKERVRMVRLLLGLTQRQFAAKLRVQLNTVAKWELGISVPTRGPILGKLLAAERDAMRIIAEQENREPPNCKEST